MNFWVFLLLLGIVVVYILVQKNKKENAVAELKKIIYAADKDQIPWARVDSLCREYNISDDKMSKIRKNMYLEMAETTNDIHAITMAVALSDDMPSRQKFLTKAAELGDTKSMCNLAYGYTKYPNEEGGSVYQFGYSPNTAFYWYNRAAQAGSGEGLCKTAEAYRDGEGVTKDFNKAISIAKEGANRGFPECAFFLCKLVDSRYSSVLSDSDKVILLERVIARRETESYAQAAQELGYIYGSAYLSNTTPTPLSDRRKAAYCFALAHFADDWSRDNIFKTGYNPSQYELSQWQQDAANLLYRPG